MSHEMMHLLMRTGGSPAVTIGSAGADGLAPITNAIYTFCNALKPVGIAAAVAAFIIIGIMFLLPSNDTRQMATKALPFTIIGLIIVNGAAWIGSYVIGLVQFGA